MRPTVAALSLLMAACFQNTFQGDEKALWFSSNLGHDWEAWNPQREVALGSNVAFEAVPAPISFTPVAHPQALPLVDGGSLQTLDAGMNRYQGRAVDAGSSRFDWTGPKSDHFLVQISEPVQLEASDPLLFYREVYPQYLRFDGGTWPDVGEALALSSGTTLYLELVPRGSDGGWLGFSSDLVVPQVTAPFTVTSAGHGLYLSAPDAGSAAGTLTLTMPTLSTSIAVRTVDPASIASVLDLQVQMVSQGMYLFKASAYFADGGLWWEPPINWTWDARLSELDAGILPMRSDTRLLMLDESASADAGPSAWVQARLGEMVATSAAIIPPPDPVEVESRLPDAGHDAGPGEGHPGSRPAQGCACSGAPGALTLPVVLIGLLALRTRRRRGAQAAVEQIGALSRCARESQGE